MENKKGSLSTVFLVIAIILIVVMGAFMYMQKTESDKQIAELENNASKLQETINNLQGKIDSISNTINNNKVDTNTEVLEKDNKNDEQNNKDIIGIWRTYQAIDLQTAKKIDNLTEIFGSSYISYGSYLKLNKDGTFLDNIYPVTSGEYSVEGTYTIEKDYYRLGDCYIFLDYSDGRSVKVQRIYYEDNIPVLSFYTSGNLYQFDLKK